MDDRRKMFPAIYPTTPYTNSTLDIIPSYVGTSDADAELFNIISNVAFKQNLDAQPSVFTPPVTGELADAVEQMFNPSFSPQLSPDESRIRKTRRELDYIATDLHKLGRSKEPMTSIGFANKMWWE